MQEQDKHRISQATMREAELELERGQAVIALSGAPLEDLEPMFEALRTVFRALDQRGASPRPTHA
jgi:hypothetical protein